MSIQQVEFPQGIARTVTLDVSEYGSTQTWVAALVNPSTNKRYVSDTPVVSGDNVSFTWPSGLDNNLKLDATHKNGTAWMDVGVYNLEIYTSNRNDIGIAYGAIRVVKSNLMTSNAPTAV